MNTHTRIGSAFRLIGFVFLVVAVVPMFRGEGLNASVFASGLAFWIIGLIIGINAKRDRTQ